MARKTVLTPEVHNMIMNLVRMGAYRKHAAAAAGVSDETVKDWIKRGTAEPDEEPYGSFVADLEQAQGEDAARDVGTISKAAKDGDWKAAAWKLERKYPKVFGSLARHEVTGEDGGAIKVSDEVADLSDEDLEERVRGILAKRGSGAD